MADYISKPTGIKQQISAGNQFDGTAPAGSPAFANDMYIYAEATSGGLFEPVVHDNPKTTAVDVIGIEIDLADQDTWTLSRVDADGHSVNVYSGTNDQNFVATDEGSKFVLMPGEKLKLVTVNATLAMKCTIKFAPRYWGA